MTTTQKKTGPVGGVQCPVCSSVLDLTALQPKIKGTIFRCGFCREVLKTAGGVIAAIEEIPIQSVTITKAEPADLAATTIPSAPAATATG
jgi:hypothetical protein